MNVEKSFEKQPNSSVKLKITVSSEDVDKVYADVLQRYSKNVQVPGFRKGHAPAKLLESRYGDNLLSDTTSTLVEETANEILDNEKEYVPLGYEQPSVVDMPKLVRGSPFTYVISYDVKPDVQVGSLQGIAIKVPQVDVGDAELNEALEKIQLQNATIRTKDDGATVEQNDVVTVDFVELNDKDDEVPGTKRTDFTFTVNSSQNIYRFDEDVIGLKKGDTKVITKTYDKDSDFEALKGKTLKLRVKVDDIKVRNVPPIDDNLAQDVNEKFKTVDDLKSDVKIKLERARDEELKAHQAQLLIEEVVKKYPVELPQSLVNIEVSYRLQEIGRQFHVEPKDMGKLFTVMGEDPQKALGGIVQSVEEALRARLTVDALIKQRNISVSDDEVTAKYAELAKHGSLTEDEVKKHYEGSASDKQYLIASMKDTKLYDELYKEVEVTTGDKMALADLLGNADVL